MFNGSGVFTRLYNWVTDRANAIVISADRMDAEMDGMATGLSTCITKDGQTTITNNIPLANFKLTGLGTATVRTDAANLGQVQDSTAQWSAVTGGTANAITLSPSPAITAYVTGQTFRFKAVNTNTAATTTVISGLTAKALQLNAAALAGGEIISGSSYEIIYDGTAFQLIGAVNAFGDTITLTSTDAGAGVAPTVNLFRNSASPAANDLVGQIKWTGQNSTPATVTYGQFEVRIDDPVAATEDSSAILNLLTAGATTQILLNAFGLSIGGATLARVAEGRLTLTSGTAVTTADVTAATTVYWTPFKGNQHAVYNGSRWEIRTFSELSIAVPAVATQTYDVFLDYNSGTLQLAVLAWTNDTTRATALTTQDGILVLTGTLTKRYLGSFRTVASGQTEDSKANRFLWNYYNRSTRFMSVVDTTDTWTYSTAAFRQANGAAGNQVNFVVGISEDPVSASIASSAANSTGTARFVASGIGLDSTTVNSSITRTVAFCTSASVASLNAAYAGYPGIGKHSLMWLELGAGADTQTWYGDNAGTGQSGLTATMIG